MSDFAKHRAFDAPTTEFHCQREATNFNQRPEAHKANNHKLDRVIKAKII